MSAKVVYLPGDGVGPEVGAAALRVLDAVSARFDRTLTIETHDFGGAAIDAAGDPLPPATEAAALAADAVLLGAVGGPAWDGSPGEQRPERGLLRLRRALGVWANLRVFKPHPAAAPASPIKADRLSGVDILFVRELTGGVYFGDKGREGDRAFDTGAYTVAEIERVARRAGELARGRRGAVASIDKANVMETSRLWRETVSRVFTKEFPDVELEHLLVDAAAMHLINRPSRFDVVLTENLFGDILTDEAAVLCGSMGLVPSASVGDGARGLYEPIHGSAPDIAGRGVANPVGMVLSAAMMLRHSLGWTEGADAVEAGVATALSQGRLTRDLGGDATTMDIADAIADHIRATT